MDEHKRTYSFAVLGLVVFAGYLLTLSRNYLGDGIQFVMATEAKNISLMPNHMLYNAFIFVWYEMWRLLGWTGNAIMPLQIFSAFWGAVSVVLFSFLILRITNSLKITVLVSFGFAVSFATWLFSTDVEVVTFPLALNLLLLNIVIASPSHWLGRPWGAAATGLLTSISILSYQTGVFMVPVAVLAYLLRDFGKSASKRRLILLYLFSVLIVAFGCYILIARLVYNVATVRAFVHWQFFLSGTGPWGAFSRLSLLTGILGFVRTLSSFPGLSYIAGVRTFFMFAHLWEKVFFISYYSILAAMVGYMSFMLILRWRILFERYRVPLSLFAVSGFLYAAFAVYWMPADIQFWVPVAASWWGGMALFLASHGTEGGRNEGLKLLSSRPGVVAVSFVCIISVVNFFGTVLPDRKIKNNLEYNVAVSLKDMVKKNDLVITSGADRIFLYIPYFLKINVLSIFLLGVENGTSQNVPAEIDRRIEEAVSEGNDVYLVGMKPGRFVVWKEMNKLGIDQGFAGRYHAMVCSRIGDEEILKLTTDNGTLRKNR
jgi:hypothetical protein